MTPTREEVRPELRVYMSRGMLSFSDIARGSHYDLQTIHQFASSARFGNREGIGDKTAANLRAFMESNPLPLPELPGRLHQTRATKEMDAMLEHVRSGGWGILSGPSGAGKSFLLEYRAAEAARDLEPRIAYVRTSLAGMTAGVMLRRIAAQIGAAYSQYTDGARQSVLRTIQQRRTSLALVLDEADYLYKWVETLETLRELGDLAPARPGRPGIGILVAGNERVWKIFEDRRSVYFEKWRGRIEDEGLRVVGPSAQEAAQILTRELGELKPTTVDGIVEACTAQDPESRRRYVNCHRFFKVIEKMKKARQ
jgi:hypothetical protein